MLFNVRLIEELRSSRQRLVKAQDEERRRIERNIHDGAQQQLVALSVKARLAQTMSERDPEGGGLLATSRPARRSPAGLRDLARGIYPPLLADQGLPAALEAQARKSPVPVRSRPTRRRALSAGGGGGRVLLLPGGPAEHGEVRERARGRPAAVRRRGELTFVVRDDGRGFDTHTTGYGTGLQGMADRIEPSVARSM